MIKIKDATVITPKKDRQEGILIPEVWAMKFFGYTLSEIKQFIDFGKSRNFKITQTHHRHRRKEKNVKS